MEKILTRQEEYQIEDAVMSMLGKYQGNRINLSYVAEHVAYDIMYSGGYGPELYLEITRYAADWVREQSKEGKIALIKGSRGGVCIPTELETHLACTGCGEKRWFATSTLKSKPYLCSTCEPPVYESRLYGDVVSEYPMVQDPSTMTREELEAEIARLQKRVEMIKRTSDLSVSDLVKGSDESRALIDSIRTNGVSYDAMMKLASQEKTTSVPIKAETVEVINDRTCSACGNDKCSSSEKSCWKCGAGLHG